MHTRVSNADGRKGKWPVSKATVSSPNEGSVSKSNVLYPAFLDEPQTGLQDSDFVVWSKVKIQRAAHSRIAIAPDGVEGQCIRNGRALTGTNPSAAADNQIAQLGL